MKRTLNTTINRSKNEKNDEHYTQLADAFGRRISQSGSMADFFRIRFSTKYFDSETGLYYYGYRFYSPQLMRWQNRDPIAEDGGLNLYGFCGNNAQSFYDVMGFSCKTGTFNVLRLETWEKPAANGLSVNPNFIHNNEEVFDGSDQSEVIRVRSELLKWMINEMYKRKRLK